MKFDGYDNANDVTAHIATEENATHYNMKHKKRGRALIFNHKTFQVPEENLPTREGTDVDAISIKNTLENLSFDVLLYQDLKYDDLKQLIQEFATIIDHTDYDCFVMVVLSHGDNVDGALAKNRINYVNRKVDLSFCENAIDILYAYDKPYMVEELFTPFTADLCTTLAGKPKLYFVQACRDKKLTQPNILNNSKADAFQDDFLFAHSNVLGHYSWRHTVDGSVFIDALCEELNKNAYKEDLATILTFVNQKVAINFESNKSDEDAKHHWKQIPCFASKLNRLVQFNKKENILTKLYRYSWNEETTSMSTDASATSYNMNHRYRGMALVFNHETFDVPGKSLARRNGTEKDVKLITATLRKLQFDVTKHVNKRYDELMEILANTAKFDHTDYDCFVVVVLSHGDENILYAYDQAYNIEELSKPFWAHSCITLAGKPKLFFIQASRGRKFTRRVSLSRTEADGTESSYTIPSHCDFLFAYSDIPRYSLWQNPSALGSSFIKALCTELDENAFKLDIVKILTAVNREVTIDYAKYRPADTKRDQRRHSSFFMSGLIRLVQFNQK